MALCGERWKVYLEILGYSTINLCSIDFYSLTVPNKYFLHSDTWTLVNTLHATYAICSSCTWYSVVLSVFSLTETVVVSLLSTTTWKEIVASKVLVLCLRCQVDRVQGNGLKLCQCGFWKDVMKNFLKERVFMHWNRLPRVVMESLEVFELCEYGTKGCV